MMELAQESLAGRVALLHMPSLSQHEIYGSGSNSPFSIDLNALKERATTHAPADMQEIYQRIWKGSMPGLISSRFSDRDVFYSSYLQTYIDRDVSELIHLTDKLIFRDFIRAAACRIGQLLNIHDIAQDVGVSDDTAKRWLQVLEKSDIIFYLRPYSKQSFETHCKKLLSCIFLIQGLLLILQNTVSPDILANGAINGDNFLKNYVVSEVLKTYQNDAKEMSLVVLSR